MSKRISVIVPVYNTEKYLRECIDSLINQTYTNLEIIIIDDGSTDKCPEIIDGYAKIDERIVVIHQKNAGVSAARNTGLNHATGEYVGFVDGDDYINPIMFESLVNEINEESIDVSICAIEGQKCIGQKERYIFNNKEAIIEMHRGNLFMGHLWNKLIKRSVIEEVRFNEEIAILEDLLFLHYVLIKANRVSYINKRLYHYRSNPKSALLCNEFKNTYLTRIAASNEITTFFERNLPDDIFWAKRTACISYFKVIENISRSSNKIDYLEILKKVAKEYKVLYNWQYFDDTRFGEKLLYFSLKIGYTPYLMLLQLQKLKQKFL